jgi:oligosaccharide repeat unit polymerase
VTHPRLIFNTIWFFTTIFFFSSPSYYHGESPVIAVLMTGVICFNFGSILKPYKFQTRGIEILSKELDRFLKYLLIIVIIGVIAQLKLFLSVEGGLAVKFFQVRHKISVEMIDFYGVWKYASTLSIFGMIIGRLANRRIAYLYLFSSLVLALLITGRSPVLQVFLYFIISGWIRETSIKKVLKTIFLLAGFFLIFFFSFGKFTGKFDGTFTDAILALQHYFCSGVGALNHFILERGELELIRWTDSPFVFRFFQAVLVKLGLAKSVMPLVLPFTYTPVRTNLYTQWYVYYIDFGLSGVALFSFFTGYLTQTIYSNYLLFRAKFGVVCLPSVLLVLIYQSVLQTGLQENYFLTVSSILQVILIWYGFKIYLLYSRR